MLDQLNKRFSRLYITSRDLHECLNYLGNIKLLKPGDVIKRGLLTAAVVCYVRPWSGNKPHSRANHQPEIRLKKVLGSRLLALHEHVCSIRHKAIAHSDFEWNACSWTAAIDKGGYATSGLFYDLLDGNLDVDEFDTLAETVFLFTCDRLKELSLEIQSAKVLAANSLP